LLPDQAGMSLSCLIGGFLSAALALAAASLCGRGNVSLIIWSIMMRQLPGLAFSNGIRDSMRGDMVSGGARVSDAVMRAVVLAGGAGIAMWCYLRLGGAATWLM
ncbi:MAG: threonine/serine exporter family protein, partial [Clostridia bacterium]|nr:threonine/serine exporter family protein [Clostridia bacterium]